MIKLFNILRFPRKDKRVLVLEGGGMRGVFTTGVLQSFDDRGYFPWEIFYGTSAGALSGITYALRQNYLARDAFFTDLMKGDFINIRNLVNPSKHILNLDWMIKTITGGEDPIDLSRAKNSPPLIITATHIPENAKPFAVYFNSKDDDLLTVLKATAALPFLYRGFVEYKGFSLLDGGIADPVPYMKALEMGYKEEEIVVVLTRPKGYRKDHESLWIKLIIESYYKNPKYSQLVKMLDNRFKQYNGILDQLEHKHRKIEVIYPSAKFSVDRLSRNVELMVNGFEEGVREGKNFLRKRGVIK